VDLALTVSDDTIPIHGIDALCRITDIRLVRLSIAAWFEKLARWSTEVRLKGRIGLPSGCRASGSSQAVPKRGSRKFRHALVSYQPADRYESKLA
jgi:hypothetical protein